MIMESPGISLYSKAYSDALTVNLEETERWNAYKKEHEDVQTHLKMYQTEPKINILIPVGSKAFIPGYLYHTGELLVSHGCGYFSDCSATQANHIAQHRVKVAQTMLEKYNMERQLFTNKMEVPFAEDAFSGREIIEEYDEEKERLWRDKHRKQVKEIKQREATERQSAMGSTDQEVFDRLEELELMEELEQEIDNLNITVDTDEQLRKLMNGEIKVNEKKRYAHTSDIQNLRAPSELEQTQLRKEKLEDDQYEIEFTDEDSTSSSEQTDDDISTDFVKLLQDTKSMNKSDKIASFKARLLEIKKALEENQVSVEEKVQLYDLRYEIEEALDFMQPSWETVITDDKKSPKKRKSIKFADTDNVKYIEEEVVVPKENVTSLVNNIKTLTLNIRHTSPEAVVLPSPSSGEEINSPVDIYRLFEHCLDKEYRTTAEAKSILKNRDKVLSETHLLEAHKLPKSVKERTGTQVDIIGDIIERKVDITAKETNNVSHSASKSLKPVKVSRFKQQRC